MVNDLFDEYDVNIPLLLASMFLFVLSIIESDSILSIVLFSVTILLFGWSFVFAKKKSKHEVVGF